MRLIGEKQYIIFDLVLSSQKQNKINSNTISIGEIGSCIPTMFFFLMFTFCVLYTNFNSAVCIQNTFLRILNVLIMYTIQNTQREFHCR